MFINNMMSYQLLKNYIWHTGILIKILSLQQIIFLIESNYQNNKNPELLVNKKLVTAHIIHMFFVMSLCQKNTRYQNY